MSNEFYEEYHDGHRMNQETKIYDYSMEHSESTYIALTKVFLLMFAGVGLSFLTGLGCVKLFYYAITSGKDSLLGVLMVAMIASFIIEIVLSFTISRNARSEATVGAARTGFIIYSICNGVSLSVLFAYIGLDFVYQVFAIVAIYFLLLSGFTMLFRKKFTTFAQFAAVGIVVLVICSAISGVYSILLLSGLNSNYAGYEAVYLFVSIVGLVVFSIITIVDVNRIKSSLSCARDRGVIVMSAFNLYLDFINILIYVLRIAIILGSKSSKRR